MGINRNKPRPSEMNETDLQVTMRRNIRQYSIKQRSFGKNCMDRLCEIEIAELSMAVLEALEHQDLLD